MFKKGKKPKKKAQREEMQEAGPIKYSTIKTAAKRDPESKAAIVFKSVNKALVGMFPGLSDPEAGNLGGQTITGFVPGAMGPTLGLQQETAPLSITNGDSDSNNGDSTPKSPCGGVVKWNTPWGKSLSVVKDDCKTTFLMTNLRTLITQQLWTGAAGEAAQSVGADPNSAAVQQFLNTENGMNLVTEFPSKTEDGKPDATLRVLLNLSNLFQSFNDSTGGTLGDFGDINAARSLFGVVSRTSVGGEILAANLSKLAEDPDIELSIASKQEMKGALVTLQGTFEKLNDFQIKPEYNHDTMKWLSRNVTLVRDSNNKYRVYFNSGFEGMGVEFDGGRQPQLVSIIQAHNDWIEANQEDWDTEDQDLRIPFHDHGYDFKPRNLSDSNVMSNGTKDVTEDAMKMLLFFDRGDARKAANLYQKLKKDWEAKLEAAAHISAELSDTDLATTEYAQRWIDEAQEFIEFSDPEGKKDFRAFMKKIVGAVGDRVRKSGALASVRVGGSTGEGKEGFKSDQFLIFGPGESRRSVGDKNEDGVIDAKEAKALAKKYNTSKKPNATKLSDVAALAGMDVESLKSEYSLPSDYTDDTEVYLGYDTVKHSLGAGFKLSDMGKPEGLVGDILAQQKTHSTGAWHTGMFSDLGMGVPQQEAMYKAFDSINDGFKKYNELRDAERSGSLTHDQIQRELLVSMPELGQDPEDPNLANIKPADPHEENTYEGMEDRIKRQYLYGKLQQGLKDPKTREAYRHAAAFIIMRGGWDVNNANDIKMNLRKGGEAETTSRNKTLSDELYYFLNSKNPIDEISFRESGFNIGGLGVYHSYYDGEHKGGSVELTSRKFAKRKAKEKEAAKAKATNDSTEYSSTELMHKLLEVQQLMFTNLIKE